MNLPPASLASMGITTSHLSQLVQIASLTGANQSQLTSLATKQAQFEQEYLRSYLGASPLVSSAKPGTSTASQAKTKQTTASVKQTAQFKAKQTTGAQAAAKKTVNKVMNSATKNTNNPQGPNNSSLSSVAAKLSTTGVTLSKPPVDKTKESQAMAKKFPYLNITPLSGSGSSQASTNQILTVKPNSKLLKPGASGGVKSQVNIAGVVTGKANTNTPKAGPAKSGPADAKNKLALFKAQVNLFNNYFPEFENNICR